MLGRVIRVVEVPISLSIGVMRRSVELTGRLTSWALNEVASGLGSDRARPGSDGDPSASAPPPPAPPPPAAEPSPPVGVKAPPPQGPSPPVGVEAPTAPGPTAEVKAPPPPDPLPSASAVSESETSGPSGSGIAGLSGREPLSDAPPEPAAGAQADTVVSDIAGGEEGATVEHEPGAGTSVRARTPHSSLNNPVTEPDPTEWPDPYDQREDPRDPGDEMVFGGDAGHTPPGATSTSEPHPSQDPEAEPAEGPKRDKVDR
jgi:hypothetical protein